MNPTLRRKFEKQIAKKLGLNFPEGDPVWCDARRVLITGGWRAGKTTRSAFKAFREALNPTCKLIWLVGPDYVQAQEEFRMLLEWSLQLGLIRSKDEFSMPAEGSRVLHLRTGCTIMTKSAKHPERLGSVAPDGIVLCEPGQMTGEVYIMALGRLAQKRGWLTMAGTLEDDLSKPRWAWYEDLAVEWMKHGHTSQERAFSLPTWSNVTMYPLGEADPELQNIKARVSEFTWARKYGGRPMGVENPVFPLIWESWAIGELMIPLDSAAITGGAIGVDYGRCVPTNTEILTRTGFKLHSQVEVGDEVAIYHPDDDALHWGPLQAKYVYPSQPLVRIEQKGFHFSCTPNHAWPVEMKRTKRIVRRELCDIPRTARIRVVAPMRNEEGLDCTPAEAAVLGWLVTDGWTQGTPLQGKFSAVISQKNKVAELLQDLDESGIPYTEQGVRNTVRRWHLHTASIRDLFTRIGYEDKSSLPQIVCQMSYVQRERLFNAMMLAEGHKGNVAFSQNEGPVLEAFYLLATLQGQRMGKASSITSKKGKVCKHIHLSPSRSMSPFKVLDAGKGETWCPTVSTGYWVARQDGQVTITGNTFEHPSAIVAVTCDNYGRYWIREGWTGIKADPTEIASIVKAYESNYNIYQGCVDPNQGFLGDMLGYYVAAGGGSGGKPSEMRISLVNGLLENRALYFDSEGVGVDRVWDSMRICARMRTARGELVYNRPEGDDLAMAVMYAVEVLRGNGLIDVPLIDSGSARMEFLPSPSPMLAQGKA